MRWEGVGEGYCGCKMEISVEKWFELLADLD